MRKRKYLRRYWLQIFQNRAMQSVDSNAQEIPSVINRKEYTSEYVIFNNQIQVQILKAARDLKKDYLKWWQLD